MKTIHFEVTGPDQSLMSHNGAQTFSETLSMETVSLSKDAEIISVFVNSVIDTALLDALSSVKLIITRSVGFDHIDVAYAKTKGITVCNVPGYGSRTVAEFTFALLLSLSRKVTASSEQIKLKNDWDMSHFEGFDLYGKTLGVVGTGRIGQNVIQIAKGFNMNVIATDAFPNYDKAHELGFKYSSLNELLAVADVVTLHVPATPETHHLINSENIKLFKPGALVINTARGDVIDPEALIYGLNEKILGGAALDVLEGEHELKEESEFLMAGHPGPEQLKILLEDHVLMDYDNVIITPHIAFNTKEARKEIINITLKNIEQFINGEPQNVVD